jgi:hypothetical protein
MFRNLNKNEYRFMKRTKKKKITKLFRSLKKLCKFPKFVEFYNNSILLYKNINIWFLRKINKNYKYNNIVNLNISKIFAKLSLNYRKNMYTNFLKFKFKKVKIYKKYFKKIKRLNKIARYRNWVIDTLDFKYDRFKNTEEVRRIVKKLHKKIHLNNFIEFFKKKYKINLNSNSTFSQIINVIKKKNKLVLRLSNTNRLKYNIRNFNFFQISKNVYNKKIFKNWFKISSTIKNNNIWEINDNNDVITPSVFLNLYLKSKKNINNLISKHNLFYYNKSNYKTNIENILLKKNSFNININTRLLKKKILKFIKKKKKKKILNYIISNKIFSNIKHFNLWIIIKNQFIINKGFNLKLLNINFNKIINNKIMKLNYYNNNLIKSFSLIFFIKFINIYNVLLIQFPKIIINNYNKFFFKKVKQLIYKKEKKKIFWN